MFSKAGTQNKHQNTHVLQSSRSKQSLINHVLQGPCPTHTITSMLNKTYALAYAQYIYTYNKSSYSCVVGSYAQYTNISIKETLHAVGLMPISVRSKFGILQQTFMSTIEYTIYNYNT